MACPYQTGGNEHVKLKEKDTDDEAPKYSDILKLDTLLGIQDELGTSDVDEHLFVLTHQVYELWFKQILLEVDSVNLLFAKQPSDEGRPQLLQNRLKRILMIFKLVESQFEIVETISLTQFADIRGHMMSASGFQSLQFRLIENVLGIRQDARIKHKNQHYQEGFADPISSEKIKDSMIKPSLFQMVELWLERIVGPEVNAENLRIKFETSVDRWIDDQVPNTKESHNSNPESTEREKLKKSFDSILDKEVYESYLSAGERRLSFRAFIGALMIHMYDDLPQYQSPLQILNILKDIDTIFMKWRWRHMIMAQRFLGCKTGTGGTSGYMYLRATASDRYRIFPDLFNLASFVIPRRYLSSL